MPVRGTPLTDGPKRNRVKPVHDFTDVLDVPFAGVVPVSLPESRTIVTKQGVETVATSPLTRAWWASLSRMPHCKLWRETDWHFALSTALLYEDMVTGNSAAAGELRQREAIMGTTRDACMKLRIRYVDADVAATDAEAAPAAASGSATVTDIGDRRARLTSA